MKRGNDDGIPQEYIDMTLDEIEQAIKEEEERIANGQAEEGKEAELENLSRYTRSAHG